MNIRIYRLTGTGLATATGVASTTVLQKGTIVGVAICGLFTVGAGSGRMSSELALNNTSNGNAETATGAPTENIVCRATQGAFAGAASAPVALYVPMDKPVSVGNVLCINQILTGNAPGTFMVGFDVFVKE